MPKKLIVCADGTWNRDEIVIDPTGKRTSTNVAKLAVSLSPFDNSGNPQVVFYMEGVGSQDKERVSGGAFGWGLSRNILRAYIFLIQNFTPGDQIFLFGFSRGAYTVRSLAGLICNSGIVKDPTHAARAMEIYREKSDPLKSFSVRSRIFRTQFSHDVSINFLGVWDTVGSMGIPLLWYQLAKSLGWEWDFHTIDFKQKVLHASHAVSMDEKRSKFRPDLKKNMDGDQIVEKWFHGVHSDIGGGYAETGLSNITLEWMIEQAKAKGLCFIEDWRTSLDFNESNTPDNLSEKRRFMLNPAEFVRHEEWTGFFKLLDRASGLPKGYRRKVDPTNIHESVQQITDFLRHHFIVKISQKSLEIDFEFVKGDSYTVKIEYRPIDDIKSAKLLQIFQNLFSTRRAHIIEQWIGLIGNNSERQICFKKDKSPQSESASHVQSFTASFVAADSGGLRISSNLPIAQRYFARGSAIVRIFLC